MPGPVRGWRATNGWGWLVRSVRDWVAGRTWILAAFMALLWIGVTYGIQAAISPAWAGWPLLSGALIGGIIYGDTGSR
ncbi:hypothetical protein [Arthrobacter sp. NyZ413]|uniref:hypothetical protein n=1 Tax=Arthrobacter sp. NyZ413 TaxID=3144669 RepID=UPI003BF863E4